MISFFLFTFCISLFIQIHSTLGVVLNDQTPNIAVLQCILTSGYDYAVTYAVSTNEGVPQSLVQTLLNIKNSEMEAQIVFVPCRGRNATKQVQDFIQNIPKDYYENIWLLANSASLDGRCHWNEDNLELNVGKMIQLITEFKKNNYTNVGFVANQQYWDDMFGGSLLFKDFPLFWHPEEPNDNPSFSDFKTFGDWKSPVEKLYSERGAVCGDDYSLCFES